MHLINNVGNILLAKIEVLGCHKLTITLGILHYKTHDTYN
jgi:hypothetical protein